MVQSPQSEAVERSEVIFLKIKKSTLHEPNSTIFEVLDSCVLSLSVAQKGLDAIVKMNDITINRIRSIIGANNLSDIVEIVRARKFVAVPLTSSPYQKNIGLYCIRCNRNVEQEVAKALVSYGALQVFMANDEYNIWSLFTYDKNAHLNEMMKQKLYKGFPPTALKDSTLYVVLDLRKNLEGSTGGLSTDVDCLISDARYEERYWPALLNIIRLLLFGPRTKRSIAATLKLSIKHVERCIRILRIRNTIRTVGKEGSAEIYDLNNEKFKNLFNYLRE